MTGELAGKFRNSTRITVCTQNTAHGAHMHQYHTLKHCSLTLARENYFEVVSFLI